METIFAYIMKILFKITPYVKNVRSSPLGPLILLAEYSDINTAAARPFGIIANNMFLSEASLLNKHKIKYLRKKILRKGYISRLKRVYLR